MLFEKNSYQVDNVSCSEHIFFESADLTLAHRLGKNIIDYVFVKRNHTSSNYCN